MRHLDRTQPDLGGERPNQRTGETGLGGRKWPCCATGPFAPSDQISPSSSANRSRRILSTGLVDGRLAGHGHCPEGHLFLMM